MGMSTWVEAIRPPDEKWKKMKAAYEACDAAGTDIPKEVDDFFGNEPPDDLGVVVKLIGTYDDEVPEWVKYINTDGKEGFEVDITKLPKDVTVVRFTNSY